MMNLRRKLLYAFISLIIIPVFLLGTVTFVLSLNLIEKKHSEQTELTLKALSQSIEYVLNDASDLSASLIGNFYLQNILSQSGEYSKTAEDQLRIIGDERTFRRMLIHHATISYAFMYNSSGHILPLYTGTFKPIPYEQFKQHPVYEQVVEQAGLPVWIGPGEYPELTGDDPVITQIRLVRDLHTLESRGILCIQMKLSDLEKLFYPFYYDQDEHSDQFMVINKDGLVLFDNQKEMVGDHLFDLIPEIQTNEHYVSFKRHVNQQESIISAHHINNYDWTLVSIISWDTFSAEMMLILKWVAGLSLLSLITALLFNLVFVKRVTKSIIQVVRSMRRVEKGDMSVRVPELGHDETGLLAKGFNSLVEQTDHLLKEVKREQDHKARAEMMVLQAQIKPHFLFNTLESINVLAVQNEGEKVSHMVQRLGNILRISIQESEMITIRQEIEHLTNYLDIQKYRFGALFDYEIVADEAYMDHQMIKITLQPLVENCIQHGFEGITYQGFISVRLQVEPNYLVFWIADNGKGISNETLAKFQYNTNDKFDEISARDVHGERRGLGVMNVADRLRINFGPPNGLYICSRLNEGTLIKCVMPKYKVGD